MDGVSTPLVIGFISGFTVLAVLSLTSFIKLSVVFMIIRQAIGLQQVPSNIILLALAAFISVFISLPVLSSSLAAIGTVNADSGSPAGLLAIFQAGVAPFQAFISKRIDPEYLAFFVQSSNDLWAGSGFVGTEGDFVIQVPAFIISELTSAFEIGFLLYLPFVAIDLAVTAILMALGMQQAQPNIIATPLKLLIFVYVDGWSKIVQGLIMTYSGAG